MSDFDPDDQVPADDPMEAARAGLQRAASVVSALESAHRRVVGTLLELWPTSAWRASGCTSAKTWLITYTCLSETDAQRLLGIVRLCVRDERIARLVLDAQLTIGQAATLARAVTRDRHPFLTDEVLDALVRLAGRGRPSDFAIAVGFWVDHADQEVGPGAPTAHGVHLSPRLFGGGEIHGTLAPGAFERVAAGIDAFLPDPDPVDAPVRRTPAERRADALDDLASFALSHADDPDTGPDIEAAGDCGHGDDPADAEDPRMPDWERDEWRAASSAQRVKPRSGVCVNVAIDLHSLLGTRAPDELDGLVRHGDGWALTQRAVEELTCDAGLVATLFAGRTRVLDANTRAERFTHAQRRALAARDGGCAFPGCGRASRHCDAHHVRERSRGGPTTIENGVLVCRFHHRLIHRDRWRLIRDPDTGTWMAIDRRGAEWKGRPNHQTAA